MNPSRIPKQPLDILKIAYNIVVLHPEILFTYSIFAFVQLVLLEILFFIPRFPLVLLFGPMIGRLEGEAFLHYPDNYVLLAKWFHGLQVPLSIVIGIFVSACTVRFVDTINADRRIVIRDVFRKTAAKYSQILLAGVLMVGSVEICVWLLQFADMKQVIRLSTPALKSGVFLAYSGFVVQIVIKSLFAFLLPLIIIDGQMVGPALTQNFRLLSRAFGRVLLVVLLPSLLYLPLLLLRINGPMVQWIPTPELMGVLLIAHILVLLFIDAVQYTALTTLYLFEKGR